MSKETSRILFLDFDGVLHPYEVFLSTGEPILKAEGSLFMWAALLEDALLPYPEIEIALSTSWARSEFMGFDYARNALPAALQARVIGTTAPPPKIRGPYSSVMDIDPFSRLTRFQQILKYVDAENCENWLAIDDDVEGWPASHNKHLVCTQSLTGLSGPGVLADLTAKLARMR